MPDFSNVTGGSSSTASAGSKTAGGRWVERAKSEPVAKGGKFRITMHIRAPYNEFNANLLQTAFRAKSSIMRDAKIDKFVYGQKASLPTGVWEFTMYCTALKDLAGSA